MIKIIPICAALAILTACTATPEQEREWLKENYHSQGRLYVITDLPNIDDSPEN